MKQTLLAVILSLCTTVSRAATIAIDDVSSSHMDVTVQWSPTDLGYDFGWAQTTSPPARASVQAFKIDQRAPALDALTVYINPPFGQPVWLEVHFDDKGIAFDDAIFSSFQNITIPGSVSPVPGGDGIVFSLDAAPELTVASVLDSSSGLILAGCSAAFLWLSGRRK